MRLVAAVLVCCFALPAADGWAAAKGAVVDITWGQSRPDVDHEIDVLKAAGAQYLRANVNWIALEPDRKGVVDAGALATYDYAIDRAVAAGIQIVMPISDGVSYWASGDPRKYTDAAGDRHWDRFYPPADFADYGEVAGVVARHFAARGVHIYEVWNEPNIAHSWSSGPNPAQYVQMLAAAYPAIKAGDAQSTVLLGGLSKNDFSYLEGVYRAGGERYFDAVAVHPYTYGVDPTVTWKGVNAGEDPNRLSWNSFPAIQEIRRSMDAFGDTAKPVWITEFGYSTTSHDGGVSEARQADFLTKAYAYLEQFPWVKALLWYSARNSPFYGDADTYEGQFGLCTAGWREKPSFAAFAAVGGAEATPGPAPASAPATPPTSDAPTPAATPPAVTATPAATSPAPPAVPRSAPPARRAGARSARGARRRSGGRPAARSTSRGQGRAACTATSGRTTRSRAPRGAAARTQRPGSPSRRATCRPTAPGRRRSSSRPR